MSANRLRAVELPGITAFVMPADPEVTEKTMRLIALAPKMAEMLDWLAHDPNAGTFPDIKARISVLLAHLDTPSTPQEQS